MKGLVVVSLQYQYLEANFKEWLQTLGYAPSTAYNSPIQLREFFHYLEQQGVKRINQVKPGHVKAYCQYLLARPNTRTGEHISGAHVNKLLQALKNFSRYLKETGQGSIEVNQQLFKPGRKAIEVYSLDEVQHLYGQCGDDELGARDRAMLAVFYACGLRRNEGAQLDVQDIYTDRIYVRAGKNYKERYVPFTKATKQDLFDYLEHTRPSFKNSSTSKAFFLSARGTRLDGQSLYIRLKLLSEKAGIGKENGLHLLRHSIATHLLQSGMKLHRVARFLGHASLESTQIYTHLANET